jgi:hypothetical protein
MQPFPIPYEPTNLVSCFTLRNRREDHPIETTNARLIEHWQTDAPDMAGRDVSKAANDTNPIASRLYRENMQRSQPYVVDASVKSQYTGQITKVLQDIQQIETDISTTQSPDIVWSMRVKLEQKKDLYRSLLEAQRVERIDSTSQNPYFDKYDVAGDSRNMIRELRGAVSEDIQDHGVSESKKLLERGFQNRWLPEEYATSRGINSLEAYDLMRPKFTDMSKRYN